VSNIRFHQEVVDAVTDLTGKVEEGFDSVGHDVDSHRFEYKCLRCRILGTGKLGSGFADLEGVLGDRG
jgi:hypothetical protein